MHEDPKSRRMDARPDRRRAILFAAEFQELEERARQIGRDIAGVGEVESDATTPEEPGEQRSQA